MVVIQGAAWISGYDATQQQLIFLAAISLGVGSLADLFRAGIRGVQRMEWDTISRSADKVIALIFILLIFGLNPDLHGLFWALIGGSFIGLIIGWAALRRLSGRLLLDRGLRNIPGLVKEAAPLGFK